jgi:two-component system, NarL family, sensor histidine kinase DesK
MNQRIRDLMRSSVWRWAGPVFALAWLAVLAVAFAASEDSSAWRLAVVGVGLAAFCGLFMVVVITERPPWLPVAGMLAAGVVLTLVADETFAVLFGYVASAVGVRVDGRQSVLAVGGITALAAATLALTTPEGAVFWGITSVVLGAGTLWLLIGGLLRANAALREARAELAELAVAEERLRFARDVHDLLGHDLSLIAIKAELAGRLLPAGADRAAAEVEDIRSLTRRALAQVREAVSGYRQPTLAGELAGARVALEAAGVELRVDDAQLALEPEVESVLAWAVREGATNVIRHSGARHAAIAVRPGAGTAELEIVDDGSARPAPATGHGLDGLRERAMSIGGQIETGAAPQGGFLLRVSVPARPVGRAA